jgi:hypothetical protein
MLEIDVAVARPSNSARFCATLVSSRKSSSDPAQPLCMQQLYEICTAMKIWKRRPAIRMLVKRGE